jgi:hypothetical protein
MQTLAKSKSPILYSFFENGQFLHRSVFMKHTVKTIQDAKPHRMECSEPTTAVSNPSLNESGIVRIVFIMITDFCGEILIKLKS